MAVMQVIDHTFRISETIVLQFNYKYVRCLSFLCQSNKHLNDSNDPNKQITL